MRYLMLLAAGLYVAYRLEKRAESQKNFSAESKAATGITENNLDGALEDSFPASDPPNLSSSTGGYHH